MLAARDECRGIFRPLANDAPPQAIAEEAAGALEISDAQTDVIDAACGGCGVLCHGILLWCADLVNGSPDGSVGPDARVGSCLAIGRHASEWLAHCTRSCRIWFAKSGPYSPRDL